MDACVSSCAEGSCHDWLGTPAALDSAARARPSRPGAAPEPTPDVDEREAGILSELAREGDAHVTFAGLKRRLGLHQQVLTRTLRRLEGAGLVSRDEKGYHATERGYAASVRLAPPREAREVLTVVQALLPPSAQAEDVARRLAKRWFQGLRWYGQSDAPGETTLTWLTEPDGARVRVRISGGAVSVDAEVAADAPESGFAALRPILAGLSEVYGADSRGTGPGHGSAAS